MRPLTPLSKRWFQRGTLALFLLGSTLDASAQVPSDPSVRVPVEHWGCSNCHLPDASNEQLVSQRPGPDLSGIGGRISAGWMKRWIARPAALRGAPTMPRLFGESAEDQADLEAVVQYLASLAADDSVAPGRAIATEGVVLSNGRRLYHTIGCVACHGALESPAAVFEDEFLSKEVPQTFVFASFADLDGKWYAETLSAFLRDPVQVHRDGRMPGMNLNEAESDALANYLLTRWKPAGEATTIDAQLVQRGAAVFLERDCIACHTIEGVVAPARTTTPLAQLDGNASGPNCLTSGEWDGPRYDFPAPALAGMFKMGLRAANGARIKDPRLDALERQVNRLNCRGCHEMDSQGGLAKELRVFAISLAEDADLGDEGRYPPHLNGVGSKLTTSWFKEVLHNSGTARPYLAMRMPQFGHAVDGFAEGFALKAGVKPNSDSEWPAINDEQVLTGRKMMGTDGISCVTCHSFGDFPALGTPGPNMKEFSARLRYAWWNGYIKHPEAFKPGTRMPRYTDDQGHGVFTAFYGGDFQKQTDAMWSYFSLGMAMSAPEGVGRKRSLVLQVGDRPRVFRTFLDSAGSRGIAVGFPVGMHFAYDGSGGGLREVWRGSFIDASGAWAGRGGNSTGAPGEVLWSADAGPAIMRGKGSVQDAKSGQRTWHEDPKRWPDASNVKFRGYRIDKDGTPIFLTEIDGIHVEERIVLHASPEPSIERRYHLTNIRDQRDIFLRPGGKVIRSEVQDAGDAGPTEPVNGESLYRIRPNKSECTITLEVSL